MADGGWDELEDVGESGDASAAGTPAFSLEKLASSPKKAKPKTMKQDMLEQMLSLPNKNAMEFLDGVGRLAADLDHKASLVSDELAFVEEDLPNRLDSLRTFRKELVEMKDEMLSLSAAYRQHADAVVNTLKQHAPEMLPRLEALSDKQVQLQQMKARHKTAELVDGCKLAMHCSDPATMDRVYREGCAHVDHTHELGEQLHLETCVKWKLLSESAQQWAEEGVDRLLAKMHYPLDDPLDERAVQRELTELVDYLAVAYRVEQREAGRDGVARVLSLLLSPLEKRFRYHFYGDRKTNDPKKPEWFVSQLVSWSTATLPLYTTLTARLEGVLSTSLSASLAWHAKLAELGKEKAAKLLHSPQLDDAVTFGHLVDELIAHERERSDLDPSHNPACNILSVLCEPEPLGRWLEIENAACVGLMDEMLASGDRWKNRFRDMEEVDTYLVCECTDQFVALLASVRERCRQLPSEEARERFRELQLVLVDDWRRRLSLMARQADSPWAEPYPHIMNACGREAADDYLIALCVMRYCKYAPSELLKYVCVVLEEWCEVDESTVEWAGRAAIDHAAAMYKHKWEQMAEDMVGSLEAQIQPLLAEYAQGRWFSGERVSSDAERELSAQLCPVLLCVRSALSATGNTVARASVNKVFRSMCSVVAAALQNIIDTTQFNCSGACQMRLDVSTGLVAVMNSVMGRWTEGGGGGGEGVKAEYDKKMTCVLGSLELLCLSAPVARLLREELQHVPDEVVEEKVLSMGGRGVDGERARLLLRNRCDLGMGLDEERGVSLRRMTSVDQLIVGFYRCPEGGCSTATGSVTLIRSGERRVLVDCGDPWNGKEVERRLQEKGLSVCDVTDVVVTHGHSDHCGNLSLFPRCIVWMDADVARRGGGEGEGGEVEYDVFEAVHFLCPGVSIHRLSGHTDCDLVVVAEGVEKGEGRGTVVVAGDLFDDSCDESRWRSLSRYPDRQAASREWIRQRADWIVPGHGHMFHNKKQ